MFCYFRHWNDKNCLKHNKNWLFAAICLTNYGVLTNIEACLGHGWWPQATGVNRTCMPGVEWGFTMEIWIKISNWILL